MNKLNTDEKRRFCTEKPQKADFSRWHGFKEKASQMATRALVVGILSPIMVPIGTAFVDCSNSSYQNYALSRTAESVQKNPSDERIMGLLSSICYGRKNAEDMIAKLARVKATGKVSSSEQGCIREDAPAHYREAFHNLQGYGLSPMTAITHLNLSSVALSLEFHRYSDRAGIIEGLYDSGQLDSLMAKSVPSPR